MANDPLTSAIVTLSQLRSGFCAKLRDFQLKIGKVDNSICTYCDLDEQTVTHLFDCPAHPTTLTPKDLWDNSRDVAVHLRSIPAFDFIPAPKTPPRCRRRARPPADPPDSPVFTPASLPPSPPLSPRIPPLMPPFSPNSRTDSSLREIDSPLLFS